MHALLGAKLVDFEGEWNKSAFKLQMTTEGSPPTMACLQIKWHIPMGEMDCQIVISRQSLQTWYVTPVMTPPVMTPPVMHTPHHAHPLS
jgi:hypothetical protein